jgi:hypothetical protein
MLGYFNMKPIGLRYHGYTKLYYRETRWVILPRNMLGYVAMDIGSPVTGTVWPRGFQEV